ncbi:MAG: tRNA-(ms[2]io[6]A)-hydroxylase [Gammaproteobacteria bacterium]|nr:tRNA-(ms[2]io[6]A)-hydroxylase [Gammaproteobacteria bacterium]NIR83606.1 tRNA-(ms[2]io[6]A)-hydroxylase [Gammaproteobacteria bacterium]NIR91579.1 tRNA-(ms[2]io[6]A)-hydroxylase [Gammaproteobacteria bacterium]NIU04768.1 tRNA-(ms[2]io[6]A)-hydroxylase [Gammaproteobacteria bacterium]NIV53118.1 tRNA-(ms[2]io[6]A)-hydroxylase [Gammaproteobacteria bacterium]
MTRRSIDLPVATDPAWVHVILDGFDAFLQDHANCERKASAVAMSLVVKYPDRTEMIPRLIALAQEELAHFRRVYELMAARGLPIVKDAPDPYVNALLRLQRNGREARFLDRMLISSLIECRGAERFGLISDALRDPALKRFYRALWASETKHGHQFVDLVLSYFERHVVYARLHELAAREAEIMQGLAWRPALH